MVTPKRQVIVHAEAFGEAQEHDLLAPMVQGTRENFQAIGETEDIFERTKLTADAGFHTEANMKMLFEEGIDGYVADILFRKRDPRFADAARHKPEKDPKPDPSRLFQPADFIYDKTTLTCICPAGKRLYRNGRHCVVNGYQAVKFRGAKCDCRPCHLRARCLRHPERSDTRQVYFFAGRAERAPETYTQKMKRKIDSVFGRFIYSWRLANRRAGVCKYHLHARTQPFHAAWQAQSQRPVAALLYRAQYRQDPSLCAGIRITARGHKRSPKPERLWSNSTQRADRSHPQLHLNTL